MSMERHVERIADSLEQLVSILSTHFNLSPSPLPTTSDSSPTSLEEEFFKRITRVYLEEEKLRRAKQGKRKSARRVSEQLGNELATFFEQQLPQLTVISRKGLLLFFKDNNVVAAVKYHSDLGYYRGDSWYDYIETTVNLCRSEFSLPSDKVFFLISSMLNGLDNSYVQRILDRNVSNNDLVTNRALLKSYLNTFVGAITQLPNPYQQVYFAAAEIHPNALATEWLNTGLEPSVIKSYDWLKPSVSDLLQYLSNNL